jgi:hypothetical protein
MDGIVMQPQVEELFFYYEEALQEIYHFYATNTENISRNMIKSTGSTSKAKSFDEQKSLLAAAKEKTQSRSGSSSRMEYPDFLRFASDFGLANRSTFPILASHLLCPQHGAYLSGPRRHFPDSHLHPILRDQSPKHHLQGVLGGLLLSLPLSASPSLLRS